MRSILRVGRSCGKAPPRKSRTSSVAEEQIRPASACEDIAAPPRPTVRLSSFAGRPRVDHRLRAEAAASALRLLRLSGLSAPCRRALSAASQGLPDPAYPEYRATPNLTPAISRSRRVLPRDPGARRAADLSPSGVSRCFARSTRGALRERRVQRPLSCHVAVCRHLLPDSLVRH